MIRTALLLLPDRIEEIRESVVGLRALGELSNRSASALGTAEVELVAARQTIERVIAHEKETQK